MSERHEGHFLGHRNCELFFQTWTAANANATLVVTHGLGEHSEAYTHLANGMNPKGWTVFAWDLRGHGRSEGKRGYVSDFRDYIEDLNAFVKHLKNKELLRSPFFLVGHSMGGLITLRTVLEYGVLGARAVALSSPYLGLSLQVPAIKDLAARALKRVVPQLTLHNEIKYEDLSRDPEMIEWYGRDPLRHDRVCPTLYLGGLENIAMVKAAAKKFTAPTLIQAAGKERVVSLPAIQEFYQMIAANRKKLIVYPDSLHEIYNDLDRDQVFRDLDQNLREWIGEK